MAHVVQPPTGEGEPIPAHASASDWQQQDVFETWTETGEARIGGAAVSFTIETPEVILDSTPLLFIQGFMGPEIVYRDLRHHAAQMGRVGITIGRAGFQHWQAALSPQHLLTPHRLTSQSPYGVLRELDLYDVDAVCHSMGAPIGVNLASKKPERFRSLTLIGPAGFTGHNALSLATRLPYAAAEVTKGLPFMIERYGAEGATAIVEYFYRNPLRPLFEAFDVSKQDVRPVIPLLQREGIKIGIGAFTKDCFFDEAKLKEVAEELGIHFSEIEAELAGHIAPQLQPGLTAREIVSMGREMNG